jgi:hypothetical protein
LLSSKSEGHIPVALILNNGFSLCRPKKDVHACPAWAVTFVSRGITSDMDKPLISSWLKSLKDYLKGFFFYGLHSHMQSEKRCMDDLFMLGIFGKPIGFPYLFNYYHLRFIPYYVQRLLPWKKRVLRERDFFDRVRD